MDHPNIPLVLGGHSFIPELGNDAAADQDAQLRIVDTCLDHGIRCFDTTYEPERIALGHVLEKLGRREEAQIIAWNFFVEAESGQYLVSPQPYAPHHIDLMQEQLHTEWIDYLVVHNVGDMETDQAQLELAMTWQEAGKVGAIGTWAPGTDPQTHYGPESPITFMVNPCNVQHPNLEVFAAAKTMSWRTLATSPFNRGWLLDEVLERAMRSMDRDPIQIKAQLADMMLRYSLFSPNVDALITGIRKEDWIAANLASVARGPLSLGEWAWLQKLVEG